MPSSLTASQEWIERWENRLVLCVWLAFVLAALFGHIHRPEDFQGYVDGGNAVLSGKDIYGAPSDTWPPLFNILCAPLAFLDNRSPYLAVLIWSALNTAAMFVFLDLSARVTYGRGLALKAGGAGVALTDPGIFLPVVATLPYIAKNFENHQANWIIFALALGGLYWLQRGRLAWGGMALGLAAALKIMPVLFLPYLAWRRQWRAAFAAAIAGAGFSLSPMLIFGWRRFWSDVATWFGVVDVAFHAGFGNQSVLAMWDRIIGHRVVPFVTSSVPRGLGWSGDPWVRTAWAATVAIVGLAVLIAFRGPSCTNSRCWALEWSVIFLISVLFGPVGWRHYFVVEMLPSMLLYAVWRSDGESASARRVSATVFLICAALAMGIEEALVGGAMALRLATASVVTDGALIMLAALLWLRWQLFSGRTEGLGDGCSGKENNSVHSGAASGV